MTKNNKKQIASQQNPGVLLAMGLVLAGITYGAFSWAIDSGKMLAYAMFFAGTYGTVHYLKRAYKQLNRN